MIDGLTARRARLADIERELARLQYRHDIAMSAFLFEEATGLGHAIAALDTERQALVASLPEPKAANPGSASCRSWRGPDPVCGAADSIRLVDGLRVEAGQECAASVPRGFATCPNAPQQSILFGKMPGLNAQPMTLTGRSSAMELRRA